MGVLLSIGIVAAGFGIIYFIISNIEDDNDFTKFFTGALAIVGLILTIIGGINLQHEKSLNRGRLEGAQNPQYLKIKEIIYDNGIPKDTVYVYEIPKILED